MNHYIIIITAVLYVTVFGVKHVQQK